MRRETARAGLWARVWYQEQEIAQHDAECRWKRAYATTSRLYEEQGVKLTRIQLSRDRAESRAKKAERDLRRIERHTPPRRRWLRGVR